MGRRIGRVAAVVLAALIVGTPMVAADGSEGRVTATVIVSPLGVTLDVAASSVPVGKAFQARANVTNGWTSVVRDILVELRLDPVGLAVRQDSQREIGQIKGGRSASVSWTVCGMSPGSYVLLVQATVDGATVESVARIVTVTDDGRRSC